MTHLDTVGTGAAQGSAQLVSVDGKHYPLESAAVTARAEGGFATSTLVQVYANPFEEPLEVQYTLPLPADGAVLGYTITIGDKVIRAEVLARDKAAKAYKQALYEGRTAGLLEQSRPDTFQQSLGNVPPKTSVKIAIDVLHPVAFRTASEDGSAPWWEYRFPTVVGVRYHGAPGRVEDAADLSPDRGIDDSIPTEVAFTLAIADEFAGSATCSTHRASVATLESGAALSFDGGERLDRDIVVRWEACAQEVGVRLVEGGGLKGDDGRYALVTVVPPASPRVTYSRDLTLLIDASGSMSGTPLELAKRVAGDLLRSLRSGDSFEVLAFAGDVRPLTKGAVQFDEKSLTAALAALKKLQASGCTEMASAVRTALASLREDSQRQIVLITDGEIGFESEVVAEITAVQNVRLHVAGVGSVPNRSLTQQAAAAGRGIEVFAGDEKQAHEASRQLVAATAQPVLTNVRVRGTAIEGDVPSHLKDVLAGQPLVFTVELSRAGGTLEVTADVSGVFEPWRQAFTVPGSHEGTLASSPLPIGALHGRGRIAEIELAGASRWDERHMEQDKQIERLGLRHQIASSQTSLIAISDEPNVDPSKPRRKQRLAVELPYGVSAEGVGLEGGADRSRISALYMSVSAPRAARQDSVLSYRREVSPLKPMKSASKRRRKLRPGSCEIVHAEWESRGILQLTLRILDEGIEFTSRGGELSATSPVDLKKVAVHFERGQGPFGLGDTVSIVLEILADVSWPAGEKMVLLLDGVPLEFELPPYPPEVIR